MSVKIFGSKVYRERSVKNSMEWAREHIKEAPDGALFIADQLEAAQGRQGRSWTLKDGQLCITAIVKPRLMENVIVDDLGIRLNQLSIAIALGIIDPLREHGVKIKWPNDFFHGRKKLGGMLMHPIWQGKKLLGIIIGFALNVNVLFSNDDSLFETATSLCMVLGKNIAMRELYYKLLASLDTRYLQWQNQAFQDLYLDWRRDIDFIGEIITIHNQQGERFNARLQQVMPNGDAIVSNDLHPYQVLPFHLVESIILEDKSISSKKQIGHSG